MLSYLKECTSLSEHLDSSIIYLTLLLGQTLFFRKSIIYIVCCLSRHAPVGYKAKKFSTSPQNTQNYIPLISKYHSPTFNCILVNLTINLSLLQSCHFPSLFDPFKAAFGSFNLIQSIDIDRLKMCWDFEMKFGECGTVINLEMKQLYDSTTIIFISINLFSAEKWSTVPKNYKKQKNKHFIDHKQILNSK